jgi:hypothetical protein
MKAKTIKDTTKALKKLLEKIHAMPDNEEAPLADLKKLERELDKSLFLRARTTC